MNRRHGSGIRRMPLCPSSEFVDFTYRGGRGMLHYQRDD